MAASVKPARGYAGAEKVRKPPLARDLAGLLTPSLQARRTIGRSRIAAVGSPAPRAMEVQAAPHRLVVGTLIIEDEPDVRDHAVVAAAS